MICFRPLEDVDSSFDCQKEILYDDTYYYTSTALLKKIIKVQLRSYMPSDVLNRLKTAGVLSGSVPKTLTFAPNESKDFRFRTLLRSSLHQPEVVTLLKSKNKKEFDYYVYAIANLHRKVL